MLDLHTAQSDLVLGQRCVAMLVKHFPGRKWAVAVNSKGGVVNVFDHFTSFKYGYLLKLKDVYTDPGLKCVMRAGGEILERARIARRDKDGTAPVHIEGVKKHHQPLNGGLIIQ